MPKSGQGELFCMEAEGVESFPVPTSPLARRDHPATSHESAAALRGSWELGRLQAEALQMVREHPGSTTHELAAFCGLHDERILGRRLSELGAPGVGLVVVNGSRIDPMTGRRCQTWAPARGGPSGP